MRTWVRRARAQWRARLRWAVVLSVALLAPAVAAPPSETEVKAVFLFNFSQFVAWPTTAFASSEAPLVIGVLGHDPFGTALDSVVTGERAGSHPLIVRRFRDVSEIGNCHILYIDRSESTHLNDILKAVRGHSTLTVSDSERAAERGVMIDLATDNHRIRLQINLAEAEASGLTLSSKLLRPSQIVTTAGT